MELGGRGMQNVEGAWSWMQVFLNFPPHNMHIWGHSICESSRLLTSSSIWISNIYIALASTNSSTTNDHESPNAGPSPPCFAHDIVTDFLEEMTCVTQVGLGWKKERRQTEPHLHAGAPKLGCNLVHKILIHWPYEEATRYEPQVGKLGHRRFKSSRKATLEINLDLISFKKWGRRVATLQCWGPLQSDLAR